MSVHTQRKDVEEGSEQNRPSFAEMSAWVVIRSIYLTRENLSLGFANNKGADQPAAV